jgi:hypothetical protein
VVLSRGEADDQQTKPVMKVPPSVADVLKHHVVFELECIDRMYLNICVPRLQSLPRLRPIGFQANRRLLDVQRISHDCALGEAAFTQVNQPIQVEDQRVSGLRYGEGRVQALLTALLLFVFTANGFAAKELRPKLAALLGLQPDQLSAGRLTYDLRRLRLHGLIERRPRTHRYRLTERGIQIAAFWTRTYNRLLRPGLAQLVDPDAEHTPLRRKWVELLTLIDQTVTDAKIAL